MLKQQKIKGTDSFQDVARKMAESGPGMTNPGALRVVLELLSPQYAGDVHNVLFMDALGIYGPRIWCLYKDVCQEDYATMARVLDAVQEGKLNKHTLNHAIDNYGQGLDIKEYTHD